MANAKTGNVYYFDSAGSITSSTNYPIAAILITGGASAGTLTLQDAGTTVSKLTIKIASNTTQFFDFSNSPIIFANGVYAQTCTNCTASLIVKGQGA